MEAPLMSSSTGDNPMSSLPQDNTLLIVDDDREGGRPAAERGKAFVHACCGFHIEATGLHGACKPREKRAVIVDDQKCVVLRQG